MTTGYVNNTNIRLFHMSVTKHASEINIKKKPALALLLRTMTSKKIVKSKRFRFGFSSCFRYGTKSLMRLRKKKKSRFIVSTFFNNTQRPRFVLNGCFDALCE